MFPDLGGIRIALVSGSLLGLLQRNIEWYRTYRSKFCTRREKDRNLPANIQANYDEIEGDGQ